MAEALGTLTLIVDATGAKREIKNVGDGLKNLTLTARETNFALKSLFPPAAEQAINRYTAALRRMKDASAAVEAQKMADQIARLDPFQKRVAASAEAMATNASKATLNMGRLGNSFGNLAGQLAGAHPIMANVAGVVGNFAVGTVWSVGVMAGLAAIALGWDAITKSTRAGERATADAIVALQALRREERQGAFGPVKDNTGAAWDKLLRTTAQIRDAEGRLSAADAMGDEGLSLKGGIAMELVKLRQRQTNILDLIRVGETKITKITEEELEKRNRLQQEAYDKETARIMARFNQAQKNIALGDFQGGLIDAKNPLGGLSSMRVNGSTTPGRIGPEVFAELARNANNSKAALERMTRAILLNAQVTEEEARATALRSGLGNSALSLMSTFGGQAGGLVSSVISGGMAGAAGGPWGIAAGSVTALVTGIASLGRSSAETARQLLSLDDSILAMQADLGVTGADRALRESQIRAQAERQREELEKLFPLWLRGQSGTQSDYAKRLEAINQVEQQRLDALGKEKDAIDALNRSMVNMVEGYKLQAVIFRHSAGRPGGGSNGWTPPWIGGTGAFGGNNGSNLTVNVTLDGQVVGTTVLSNFQQQASRQYGDSTRWSEIQ